MRRYIIEIPADDLVTRFEQSEDTMFESRIKTLLVKELRTVNEKLTRQEINVLTVYEGVRK